MLRRSTPARALCLSLALAGCAGDDAVDFFADDADAAPPGDASEPDAARDADGAGADAPAEDGARCDDPGDCAPPNVICDDGACVQCLSDNNCAGTAAPWCSASKTCVACRSYADCAPGLACSPDGRCVECLGDGDCAGTPEPWCDPASGACVACVTASHCPIPGQQCAGHACVCAGASPAICGGACVDRASDSANCGACQRACHPDELCAGAECRRYAPAGPCAKCPCSACAMLPLEDAVCCDHGPAGSPGPVCVSGEAPGAVCP